MNTEIKVGTVVALRRQFLRDTGQHTGWAPFARGVVTSVADEPLLEVSWATARPSLVNRANLVRQDQIHLEAV